MIGLLKVYSGLSLTFYGGGEIGDIGRGNSAFVVLILSFLSFSRRG